MESSVGLFLKLNHLGITLVTKFKSVPFSCYVVVFSSFSMRHSLYVYCSSCDNIQV